MDPDLKVYLDEMQRATSERLSALAQRLEALQERGDQQFKTAQQRSDTQLQALRGEMQEMDRYDRTRHEATQGEIRQIAEGHQLLREHIDRRFQEYGRNLADRHIGPLEASVRQLGEDVAQVRDDVRDVKRDVTATRSDVADLRRADSHHEARIAAMERRPQS